MQFFRFLQTYRDLGLRLTLIFIVTTTLTIVTDNINYDAHIQLRKAQPTSPQVAIVEVKDMRALWSRKGQKALAPARWLLVPHQMKRPMGTSLNLLSYSTSSDSTDPEDISLLLQRDSDGQVRRFTAKRSGTYKSLLTNVKFGQDVLINFRGTNETFDRIALFDLISGGRSLIEDKFVVIHDQSAQQEWITPVGPMDEAEIIANIVDNDIEARFVKKISLQTQIAMNVLLLMLHVGLLIYLPTSLGLISTILLYICYLSLSLFFFDKLFIWTPLITPLLQILITYILISNYKYMLNENTKWKLERKSKYLHEVEEMKTNFLSLFSHDLKTPLSKVIGLTETLLSNKNLDSKTLEDLGKVRTYSRDLERYLHRILKISQIQSEKIALQIQSGDINSVVEACIEKTKPYAKEKNITIEAELAPMFLISFDHQLLEEVIFNFIENAINYSESNTRVRVETSEVDDFVKVAVHDQGPGVPQNVQAKVWDKFFRLESKKDGYGLGLYLCKYFIQLHGGQVYLKSTPGKGSEFGFMIPIDGVQND